MIDTTTEPTIRYTIEDLLAAGTPLAWIANYEKQIILVRRPGGADVVLRESDILAGGDVLPGFAVKIPELFSHTTGRT